MYIRCCAKQVGFFTLECFCKISKLFNFKYHSYVMNTCHLKLHSNLKVERYMVGGSMHGFLRVL